MRNPAATDPRLQPGRDRQVVDLIAPLLVLLLVLLVVSTAVTIYRGLTDESGKVTVYVCDGAGECVPGQPT